MPAFRFPSAPSLPLSTDEYSRQYQDQYNNILRLYFNQLSTQLQQLSTTKGGSVLNFPSGAFHQDGVTTLTSGITNVATTPIPVASTTAFPSSGYVMIDTEIISYTAKTATTFAGTITRGVLGSSTSAHSTGAYVSGAQGTGSGTAIGTVFLNATDYSNGIIVNPSDTTKMVFDTTGTYNIQVSAQLANYTTSVDNITVWFRKNGTDIANTASIMSVTGTHGGKAGAAILTYNILLSVVSGDYTQLCFTTDSGNSMLLTYPPGVTAPVHPASPAVILTATYVSA
jgi:hypothetical protein